MSQPVDFLDIFVRSPGELLYFFTVIAISLSSMFMVLGQRLRFPGDLTARRYSLALFGIVVGWLALLTGAMVTLFADQDAVQVMPPLERFSTVATVILLIWVFVSSDNPERDRRAALLTGVALILAIAAYAFTTVMWQEQAGEVDFNLSVAGSLWTAAMVTLSVVGLLLIVSNFGTIVDAPLKILFFGLLLIGYGYTLIQIIQGNIIGDYAGPQRIAFVTAFALTPALVFRLVVSRLEDSIRQTGTQPVNVPTQTDTPERDTPIMTSPMERESVQLLRALGLILEDSTPGQMPAQVVKAVIEVLKVDVAALLRMQDANYADIEIAYDRAMSRQIDGIAINLDEQPTLVNSIERRQQRSLLVEHNDDELHDLYTRLDIEQSGPVYFQPLLRNEELVAILMVAQPYTKREMMRADLEMLKGFAVIAANLLALSYAASDAEMLAEERSIQAMVNVGPLTGETDEAGDVLQRKLKLARDQISELSQQVMQLKTQLDEERTRIAQDLGDTDSGLSISQRMTAITDEQQNLRQERDELATRLQEAEAALQGAVIADDQDLIDEMTESLRREKESLQQEKDRLQAQLDDLRTEHDAPDEYQTVLERMEAENARLSQERDHKSAALDEIRAQLRELGIEDGPDGLVRLINQLNEQRASLQQHLNRLQAERDRLLSERGEQAGDMSENEERDTRLKSLEREVNNLAGDREVAFKQREKMRVERDELVNKLETVKRHRARLLAQNSGYEIELGEAHAAQAELRQQIEQLSNEKSELIERRDRLTAEKQSAETERDQLLARVEGDRDRLQELGTSGVGSLTEMIEALTAERKQLERELNETKTRLSEVENSLEASKYRLVEDVQRYKPDNPELLLGLVEELRTPMTSVNGYLQLLLGESAGILGEMQMKFLQRVSTNIKRLSSMLDDLVHVAELDAGKFPLKPAPVDVTAIIEDAITNSSIQFREKGLTINLNLTDELPHVHGDSDAINQIIGQLLSNAYLVSPPNTEISVTVKHGEFKLDEQELPVAGLYVAISDRGGGIDPDDAPRVFARKYKAENPLIQGLGDTGVGLSIARALVEAHGGRLWLESEDNVGSTFKFILPLQSKLQIAEG